MQWLLIAVCGALGCLLRYALSSRVYEWLGSRFPYGILSVNVLGSLLMGILVALMMVKLPEHSLWRPAILVGFLGGFTTFSSFSLDTFTPFFPDKGNVVTPEVAIERSFRRSLKSYSFDFLFQKGCCFNSIF